MLEHFDVYSNQNLSPCDTCDIPSRPASVIIIDVWLAECVHDIVIFFIFGTLTKWNWYNSGTGLAVGCAAVCSGDKCNSKEDREAKFSDNRNHFGT